MSPIKLKRSGSCINARHSVLRGMSFAIDAYAVHAHTYTHAHTHRRTHERTHAHKHTHTHTHVYVRRQAQMETRR